MGLVRRVYFQRDISVQRSCIGKLSRACPDLAVQLFEPLIFPQLDSSHILWRVAHSRHKKNELIMPTEVSVILRVDLQ